MPLLLHPCVPWWLLQLGQLLPCLVDGIWVGTLTWEALWGCWLKQRRLLTLIILLL